MKTDRKPYWNARYRETHPHVRAYGQLATCHPDRKHFGKGLCEACYSNQYQRQRYATCPDWRARRKAHRQAYYAAHREQVKARAREYHRLNYVSHPRPPSPPRVIRPRERPFDIPLSELPRETPRASCDKDWWKVTKKPQSWLINT